MATLEELVVSLVAETSGLRAELDKATKATASASEKMDKAIQEFSNNSSQNVGFFQTSMATMTGFLASEAVLGVFNAVKNVAGLLFEELVVNGVSAASQTEVAVTKMNNALALTGQYSKENSKEMIELAGSLQETTRFSDDSVLSAGALLQTIGQLSGDALPEATRATVDLAAALGIDLDSAAKLVGKAAQGSTDAFKRYGVSIEEGKTKSETFANTMRALSMFQGTAAAQAKTFAGQLDIMKASWEDLTKIVGNSIIQNQAVLNVMSTLNEMIMSNTKELESNKDGFKALVAQGLIYLIDAGGVLIQTLSNIVKVFEFMYAAATGVRAPLTAIYALYVGMTEGGAAASKVLTDEINAFVNGITLAGEKSKALDSITMKFMELSVSAQNGLDDIKAGLNSTVEPTQKAKKAVEELTEAETIRNDNLKNFAEGLAEKGSTLENQYAYEQELLNLALENQTITEDEFHAARMETLALQHEAELAMLEQYNALKGSSDKTYQDARAALLKKQELETKKFGNNQLTYEQTTNKQRQENLKSTLQTMASLSQSGNKTLAAIGKASAISVATIDGFAAVQKALASAPPPVNFALAAAVGAATAVNIGKIAGVQLNKGGTVPGTGPNRDSVPAMLTPGEEVINRETAEKLRVFLDNQRSGAMNIEITLKDELVEFIEAKIIERQRTGRSLLQGAV